MKCVRLPAVLVNIAAQLVLVIYLICPSEAGWRQIDAMYAAADRHHEFLCFYAANSFPILLCGTAINVWVHAPATVRAAIAAWALSAMVLLGAEWVRVRSIAAVIEEAI